MMGMTIDDEREMRTNGITNIEIKHIKQLYENRLKADMVAMLTEIQLEIEEMDSNHTMPDVWCNQASKEIWNTALKLIEEIIEVRINNLKGK